MPCVQFGPAIVCQPDGRFLRKMILRCPFEGRRQEMVVRYEEWHGPSVYCCGCGDSWSDGERFPRPLYRYWRRDHVRKHRKLWDQATFGPPPLLSDFRNER